MTKHVAVWLDHKEARLFSMNPEGTAEAIIAAPLQNIHHRHPQGAAEPKAHPDDAKRFFHEVARALGDAENVLVLGPGEAKVEFLKYARDHAPALGPKVVGTETVDHPTDGQLVAYAKKYFKASDRMR